MLNSDPKKFHGLNQTCYRFSLTPPDGDKHSRAGSIDICRQWLRRYCRPRKTINNRAYSYSLKHCVERRLEASGRRQWIGNGEFIAAAIAEGYEVHPLTEINHDPNNPNVLFSMALPRRNSALAEEAGFIVFRYRRGLPATCTHIGR